MARLVHDESRDIDFGDLISVVYEGDGWRLTVECDRHMMTVSGAQVRVNGCRIVPNIKLTSRKGQGGIKDPIAFLPLLW